MGVLPIVSSVSSWRTPVSNTGFRGATSATNRLSCHGVSKGNGCSSMQSRAVATKATTWRALGVWTDVKDSCKYLK